MPFAFFESEWELLKRCNQPSHYWKLSVVETGLPTFFFIVSLGFVGFSLAMFIVRYFTEAP